MAFWGEPMPPGWEAKWDPGQNRYFFINHTTKTTTWVDPRSPQGRAPAAASPSTSRQPAAHQPAAHQPAAHQPAAARQPAARQPAARQPAAAGYYGTGSGYGMGTGYSTKPAAVSIPMSTITPQAKKCEMCRTANVGAGADFCNTCLNRITGGGAGQRSAESSDNETSFAVDMGKHERFHPNMELLTKLKQEYPDASDFHIRAALEANDNNEAKSRRELETKRRYKRVDPEAVKVNKILARLKHDYESCSDDILKTAIQSSDFNDSKTREKLKEMGYLTASEKAQEVAKKKRDVESTIRDEFMDLDYFEITAAIQENHYDEVLIRQVLNSKRGRDEQPVPSTSSPGIKSESRGASPAKTVSSSRGSSPAKSPAKAPVKPAAKSQANSAGKSKSPAKQLAKQRVTPGSGAASTSRASPARGKDGKDVKFRRQPEAVNIRAARPAIQSRAKGPDPSLPKGSNDGLLIKSYVSLFGPDKSLVHGPMCTVVGSLGARGPDPSNAHGPSRN